jgi:hypothetical protein
MPYSQRGRNVVREDLDTFALHPLMGKDTYARKRDRSDDL